MPTTVPSPSSSFSSASMHRPSRSGAGDSNVVDLARLEAGGSRRLARLGRLPRRVDAADSSSTGVAVGRSLAGRRVHGDVDVAVAQRRGSASASVTRARVLDLDAERRGNRVDSSCRTRRRARRRWRRRRTSGCRRSASRLRTPMPMMPTHSSAVKIAKELATQALLDLARHHQPDHRHRDGAHDAAVTRHSTSSMASLGRPRRGTPPTGRAGRTRTPRPARTRSASASTRRGSDWSARSVAAGRTGRELIDLRRPAVIGCHIASARRSRPTRTGTRRARGCRARRLRARSGRRSTMTTWRLMSLTRSSWWLLNSTDRAAIDLLEEDRLHVLDGHRVEARERLVEDQQARARARARSPAAPVAGCRSTVPAPRRRRGRPMSTRSIHVVPPRWLLRPAESPASRAK